jgi:hypothetical protein
LQKDTRYISEILNGEHGKAIVSDDYWDGREADQETVLERLLSY